MFPKSIQLAYKSDVQRDLQRPLPTEIMVRGCNQIVSSVQKDGSFTRLTLRSPYDGLTDLVLDIVEVKNGRGIVERAEFKEAA